MQSLLFTRFRAKGSKEDEKASVFAFIKFVDLYHGYIRSGV